MNRFAADWLALREPYDQRARSRSVLQAVAAFFADAPAIAIADLACGTGSTMRAISPFLPARQDWRLLDNDPELLDIAAQRGRTAATSVTAVRIDLARGLEQALDGAVDLIAASAFLDLVSAAWIYRLALAAARRSLPVYAALTYCGFGAIEPADPLDAPVLQAFDRHQRRDKGFGPALGPAAGAFAISRFEELGYEVTHGSSDWALGPRDEIQADVVSGCATAARETAESPPDDIAAWLRRRKRHIAAGRSAVRVGHVDFFAAPMGERRSDRSQSNSTSFSSG